MPTDRAPSGEGEQLASEQIPNWPLIISGTSQWKNAKTEAAVADVISQNVEGTEGR